jgi:hypothetical protein
MCTIFIMFYGSLLADPSSRSGSNGSQNGKLYGSSGKYGKISEGSMTVSYDTLLWQILHLAGRVAFMRGGAKK